MGGRGGQEEEGREDGDGQERNESQVEERKMKNKSRGTECCKDESKKNGEKGSMRTETKTTMKRRCLRADK